MWSLGRCTNVTSFLKLVRNTCDNSALCEVKCVLNNNESAKLSCQHEFCKNKYYNK